MATIKTNQNATPAGCSFVDSHGATVTIPPGKAALYAGVKSELLTALSSVLCDVSTGDIEMEKRHVETLRWTMNAVANDIDALIPVVAADAAHSQKGGHDA